MTITKINKGGKQRGFPRCNVAIVQAQSPYFKGGDQLTLMGFVSPPLKASDQGIRFERLSKSVRTNCGREVFDDSE